MKEFIIAWIAASSALAGLHAFWIFEDWRSRR